MYSNVSTQCLDNHIVLSDVSDHYGIITKLWGTTKEYCNEPIYRRKTRLSDQQWEQFNDELKKSLNEKLSKCDITNYDVNLSAEIITQTYHELIDKFMPRRKLTKRQKGFRSKPWITRGMKISIHVKNKLYKKLKRRNDYAVFSKYKSYRDILTKLKIKAQQNYY